MSIKAVISDLDGVIVTTDECHYQAWQALADAEGIYFDRGINERLRGVSRMASLDILLEKSPRPYTDEQKNVFAERKNNRYRELISSLTPNDVLPGVEECLSYLKENGIKMAVASSSKNAPMILESVGLADRFDALVDGNDISRSKPDPEVFLLAAERLDIEPQHCLVIEDAEAGVEAALRAGMRVVGVGYAAGDARATFGADNIEEIDFSVVLSSYVVRE